MQTIVLEIFNFLKSHGLTLSFCESASGGTLSSWFTEIEGASSVFKGSIVAYNNQAKINIVKIPESIIATYGAVSKQTADLMSANTNKIFKTDICVSVTGNVSSDHPMDGQPSCFHYIGITIIDKTYSFEIQLSVKQRYLNILDICLYAYTQLLELLHECIKK